MDTVPNTEKEMNLDELIVLTKNFLRLAEDLHREGKISQEEYDELTYVKKNFLIQAEKEKQWEYEQCF